MKTEFTICFYLITNNENLLEILITSLVAYFRIFYAYKKDKYLVHMVQSVDEYVTSIALYNTNDI